MTLRVEDLYKLSPIQQGILFHSLYNVDAQVYFAQFAQPFQGPFDIDAFRKHCLLNGLDDIDLTLQHVDEIRAYEARRQQVAPWLFS